MTYTPGLEIRTQTGLQAIEAVSRTWNGVTVNAVEMHWSGGAGWHDATPDRPTLSIVLEEIGGRYEHRVKLDQQLRPNYLGQQKISLIPSNMPLWGYAHQARYVRLAKLEFDVPRLNSELGGKLAERVLDEPRLMFSDDRLWQVAALLAAECEKPNECETLYGESLVVALCIDLLRLGQVSERDSPRGGLASWQVRRLIEYIDAHLPDPIHLKDLAELTALSVSHFARAFRDSFGMPPHRWHMNARLRRAQELLLETALPLADIALATGFSDQSHFTRSFGRQLGISPGVWRREHRRGGMSC
ncbi:MAG: AraC family transcriptional regulator [Acetobacteraceae bacterium]|jgi:AraC family transcriptional regulator|nr:AraC family transcriptional regulator [Acetobacteraceae bacterium]